jgi:hypothetical protein
MHTLDAESANEDRFGEVLAAYLEAVDAGWAPDRRAFLARYPQWQRELEAFFATQDEVHSLAEPFRPLTHSLGGETPLPLTLSKAGNLDPNITLGESRSGVESETLPSFGDFELLQEIARGGMGVVYRTRQISLGRIVALKMILTGRLASAADVQRFRNEAEAAALMDHPGIVPIYDVGEHRGQPWFSMKLIEGGSLAERMPRFAGDPRAAARFMTAAARAVQYAHARGVLHRDLKPANILIDENDQPLVTDFGLAKRVEGDAGLTQSGAIVGTPSYMAPEQALGKRGGLTTAADVYSLGAILYEMLTGRPPFQADNPLETLLQLRERSPLPPRSLNPKIDRDLEMICLKCLEKEPSRRYASAAALAEDLQRLLDGAPVAVRPVGIVERCRRWCRRNPSIAVLTAAVVLVLVGGMASTGYYAIQSRNWALKADAALRDKAETARRASKAAREMVTWLRKKPQHITLNSRELVFLFLKDHPQYSMQDMNNAFEDGKSVSVTDLVKPQFEPESGERGSTAGYDGPMFGD